MNVAFDPWVPVKYIDGHTGLVSLSDLFDKGNDIESWSVGPLEQISLLRLILCITHAALDGPKDHDEWESAPKRIQGAVKVYLEKWKDSFEVFHKTKPWLQMIGLTAKKLAPVSKLGLHFATGNNTTIFDHYGLVDRHLSIESIILNLLTFQCFSPGGLSSQVVYDGIITNKTPKSAPCSVASMTHIYLRGASILETIHLNLPNYEAVEIRYGSYPIGVPVWEMIPRSRKDELAIKNATTSYLGRLVPMTRFAQLIPNKTDMLLGSGLVYPSKDDGFPVEITATSIITKKKNNSIIDVISYRPDKSIWRELTPLLIKIRSDGMKKTQGALTMSQVNCDNDCDVVVCAISTDKSKILDSVEVVYHIPSKLMSEEGVIAYESEVHMAEEMANRLGWAIETYRETIDGGWRGRTKAGGYKVKAKLQSAALIQYWTLVENKLHLLFDCAKEYGEENSNITRKAWRDCLKRSAHATYNQMCGQSSSRQLKAFVNGFIKLNIPIDNFKIEIEGNDELSTL